MCSIPLAQVLVCHDAGMCVYKEDSKRGARWGSVAAAAYRPLFWADMDVFVYFSHGFVTLPPRGWVHAAHTNGVPILGTIIVEWEVRSCMPCANYAGCCVACAAVYHYALPVPRCVLCVYVCAPSVHG